MMSSNPIKRNSGWTLIELVAVMALLAVLARFARDAFDTNSDSAKAEMTLQRLEAIKSAILGVDYSQTNEGVRSNFGFIGDIFE